MIFRAAILSLSSVLMVGCAARRVSYPIRSAPPVQATEPYLRYATDAMKVLQHLYQPETGLYETTGWWNSANATTVLVDYARISGRAAQYQPTLANTFVAAQKIRPGFINKFYDDEGWWALAWIDAYDLTGDARYLPMAESIFMDMAGGWDDACGGGIWWSKDRQYKNAIANELFLSVAAHLANRTQRQERQHYLEWSRRELRWFRSSGMINAQDLINDGLGKAAGQVSGTGCTNNGRTTWTYNQGVIVGGLAELSADGHRDATLKLARGIARAAIKHLADSEGVLHDPCEPKCGDDGGQFKGIFMRNLTYLFVVSPEPDFAAFIQGNADAIWKNARSPEDQLAERWSGPYMPADAGAQSSALDALVGAATLHSNK